MKNYSNWMTADASESEELVFDMCAKTNIQINSSSSYFECILNDANEWQQYVDKIVLIKKSVYDISAGDCITVDGETYIATFETEDRDFYKSAKVRKCQSSLKWLDADSVVREAYFTLADNIATNFGIEEGKIIDIGNERRRLIIQSNVDTKKIEKNKRFIFDGRAWSVSAVDGISIDGLILLTLNESHINPTDDPVLRICDYPTTPAPPTDALY